MTTVNINVFNATASAIYVNVNNAPPAQIVTVPAASTSTTTLWAPGAATIPFSGSQPAAGVLGIGPNSCSITPANGLGTASTTVTIPVNTQLNQPLQLYLFYQTANAASWVLCNDGVAVAGSLSL
ncbi:hypothetical protein [Azospirillum sp. B2RO_4]|uniref:hypothetical protein n=1 Tax=Azospirillum sp. B2RO_4 TaxID=3027796 RepID=UPI003DA9314B